MRPAGDVENEAIVRRAYCKRTLAVLICSSAFIGILLRPLVRVRRAGGPKPARVPFLVRFPPTRGGSRVGDPLSGAAEHRVAALDGQRLKLSKISVCVATGAT